MRLVVARGLLHPVDGVGNNYSLSLTQFRSFSYRNKRTPEKKQCKYSSSNKSIMPDMHWNTLQTEKEKIKSLGICVMFSENIKVY